MKGSAGCSLRIVGWDEISLLPVYADYDYFFKLIFKNRRQKRKGESSLN